MLLILYAIALALATGGIWALAWGIPLIVLERGWTWVISGSVYLTGAAIVFALAMVVRALRQLPDLLETSYADEAQPVSPVAADGPARKHKAAASTAAAAPQAQKIAAPAASGTVADAPLAPKGEPAAPAGVPVAVTPQILPTQVSPPQVFPPQVLPAQVSPAPVVDKQEMPAPPVTVAPVVGPVVDRSLASGVAAARMSAPGVTMAPTSRPGPAIAGGYPPAAAPAARGSGDRLAEGQQDRDSAPQVAQPAIPAVVEGRLNDLLRPGALASLARTVDSKASAPSTVATPAHFPGATLAGSRAGLGAKTEVDATAAGVVSRAAAGPGMHATGSAPKQVDADLEVAKVTRQENRALPDGQGGAAAPLTEPGAKPATDLPALAGVRPAPQGVSAGEGQSPAGAPKSDLATRIGSLFSRRPAGGERKGKRKTGDGKGAAGGDARPVFPDRPVTPERSKAAEGPVFPERVVFPERGLPRPAQPAAGAVAPPGRTEPAAGRSVAGAPSGRPGEVQFPRRPEPRQPLSSGMVAAALPEPGGFTEKAPAPADVGARDETPAGPPTVVGSYTAAGTLYVMYSDGSIEAQSDGGVMHFPSLDALKAHVAKGDRA